MERSHFNLFLAAVYVAAALLAARHAGAQSGELRPASGSGGGDEATYQELVEEMRQRNSSGSLQAGEGGSGASPLHPSSEAFCGLYTHSVRLEFRGCVGYYLGISCTGRCYTEERPNVFRRRQDARVDPHITTCRCCSQVSYNFRRLRLDLTCPDNSTIAVHHLTAYAWDCGCTACY